MTAGGSEVTGVDEPTTGASAGGIKGDVDDAVTTGESTRGLLLFSLKRGERWCCTGSSCAMSTSSARDVVGDG